MMKKQFDEASVFLDFQQRTVDDFLAHLAQYDEDQKDSLLRRGYKLNKRDKRTVLFTFGEVSFYRNRWTKDGKQFIPVDDYLGLEKYSRYSKQLVYEISRLSTFTSYRKVVDIVATTYKLAISKNIVSRAIEEAGKLIEEREAYRFYEDQQEVKKIKAKTIYVEGDGVMLKVIDDKSDTTVNMDLSHFLVHTGSQEVSKNRFALENKRTFIGENHYQVKRQLHDYLYNQFEITEETVLVTNSDHGSGYTPYVFEDLAKSLGIKRHEHFWDRYHLNKLIDEYFTPFSEELRERAFQAISQHDKAKLKLAINTVESLIMTEEAVEWFGKFSRRLIRDFKYTKPPHLRGLPSAGIGVMETQHRKVTYRMKRQGRYWSRQGAVNMSKLILLTYEDQLKDLFFGNWREDYDYYHELEKIPASAYLKEEDTPSDYYLKGKLNIKFKR